MEIEEQSNSTNSYFSEKKYSPFGFRIPGVSSQEQILSILKSNPAFKDKLKGLTDDAESEAQLLNKQPKQFTSEELTQELERSKSSGNKAITKSNDDFYMVDAINLKSLSQTEQAFYLAFNPLQNVPSDNDSQIWKQAQPTIKLVGAKDSKSTLPSQAVASSYPYSGPAGGVYGMPGTDPTSGQVQQLQGQQGLLNHGTNTIVNQGGKNGVIVMQTQLTYQLNAPTKNLAFEIKDPVIQSPNTIEQFCSCQKQYEGELMIKCSDENCRYVWYHPACVSLGNVNTKDLEDINFTCKECEKKQQKKKQSQSVAEKRKKQSKI